MHLIVSRADPWDVGVQAIHAAEGLARLVACAACCLPRTGLHLSPPLAAVGTKL